jgi:GAF domain-containing protein
MARQRGEEEARRIQRRLEQIFDRLIGPEPVLSIPSNYEFTVYIHDAADDVLVPEWPDDDEQIIAIKTFRPGFGATGTSWERRYEPFATIIVTEDAVSNAEYELTKEQQEYFKDYRAVIAHPINFDGQPIGVLTAISKENDLYFGDEEEADEDHQERLRDVAAIVGPLARELVVTPEE